MSESNQSKGFTNMTPVVCSNYSQSYRTPVVEQPYAEVTYVVWPTDNFRRVLTSSTMPQEMKVKLGMVKAYNGELASNLLQQWQLALWPDVVYTSTYPEVYSDIGWKVSEHVYCLVLSNETLKKLKGTA